MIGIFDSGIGGLTVASVIRKCAPKADIIYFGDLANMPFGAKSETELLEITKNAMTFLCDHGATEIVAACNSVSLSVSNLRSEFALPLIEMSEPTVRALSDRKSGSVMVVATDATVRSNMYQDAFLQKGIKIHAYAISELASAIERNAPESELKDIIQPAVHEAIKNNIKTLVLGCTQFPFTRSVFQAGFDEQSYQIELFNPADAVAQTVVETFFLEGNGTSLFYTTKRTPMFERTVKQLFGEQQETRMV